MLDPSQHTKMSFGISGVFPDNVVLDSSGLWYRALDLCHKCPLLDRVEIRSTSLQFLLAFLDRINLIFEVFYPKDSTSSSLLFLLVSIQFHFLLRGMPSACNKLQITFKSEGYPTVTRYSCKTSNSVLNFKTILSLNQSFIVCHAQDKPTWMTKGNPNQ